jgi:phosphate transport system substrate-binding protein
MSQWPDGTPIRLVLRPVGDADSDLVKEISPAMRAAHTLAEQRPGMLFSVTDQETADDMEKIPGALGPSTMALLLSEKRALRALPLDGVEPDAGALASGRYPLVKTMYVVIDAKPSPVVQDFMAFIRSPAGKQILMRTGHWVR